MSIDAIAQGFTVLALLSVLALGLITAASLYLVALHFSLRRRGMALERAMLAQPLPADRELPDVVVQITVCNEGAIVSRAIGHASRLDWPRDKLHIQICDDSSDETTDIARSTAEPIARSGIDILVLRRPDRSGFKAGNLREAMATTDFDYFAIFDVDYAPPTDFLRCCMRPLFADPQLGFVQARPDFLNASENALTEAQSIELDAHHAVEQATRSWAGHPLQFNGTCAIWRRAAIEAAGGWRGDTLAEDIDLSYRAWLGGWKGAFLTSVTVPGELPADRRAWAVQQERWARGFGQVARGVIPKIFRQPNLPLSARLAAFLHLATTWWVTPILGVMVAAMTVATWLRPSSLPLFCYCGLALGVGGLLTYFIYLRVGNRFLRRDAVPLGRFLVKFGLLLSMTLYLAVASGAAYWHTIFGGGGIFRPTPKRGAT